VLSTITLTQRWRSHVLRVLSHVLRVLSQITKKMVGVACPQGAFKNHQKMWGSHVLRVLSKITKTKWKSHVLRVLSKITKHASVDAASYPCASRLGPLRHGKRTGDPSNRTLHTHSPDGTMNPHDGNTFLPPSF
jgi:hypothetical protein